MSDKKDGKDAKDKGEKKSKGKMGLILMAVGMLAVGGGGAFGLVASGVLGGHEPEKKEDNTPKLIRKGEVDPYAPKVEGEGEGEAAPEVEGEGGDEYRTAYYTFADEFTSNLKDSDALIQLGIACSTRRDGRVIMWVQKHELAIRSAMLAVLADTSEEDITTIEGKTRLQKRLTASINKVLLQKEGFGGIDAVYFRSFIIQ